MDCFRASLAVNSIACVELITCVAISLVQRAIGVPGFYDDTTVFIASSKIQKKITGSFFLLLILV